MSSSRQHVDLYFVEKPDSESCFSGSFVLGEDRSLSRGSLVESILTELWSNICPLFTEDYDASRKKINYKLCHSPQETLQRFLIAIVCRELAIEIQSTYELLRDIAIEVPISIASDLTQEETEYFNACTTDHLVDDALDNSLFSYTSIIPKSHYWGHFDHKNRLKLSKTNNPVVQKINSQLATDVASRLTEVSQQRMLKTEAVNRNLRNIKVVFDPGSYKYLLKIDCPSPNTALAQSGEFCSPSYELAEYELANAVFRCEPNETKLGTAARNIVIGTSIDERQLSMLDAWLSLERLAASSLIEAGMFHMLPQRISRCADVQHSIEQCLRASVCGDLTAILESTKSLPPFMKLGERWRAELLNQYSIHLVVAARISTAKLGRDEAFNYLFRLLSSLFQHEPRSNAYGQDLLAFLENIFTNDIQLSAVEVVPGQDKFQEFIEQEKAQEERMKLLLQSVSQDQRADLEKTIDEARVNRWNMFMNQLLDGNNTSQTNASTIEQIKSLMRGGSR